LEEDAREAQLLTMFSVNPNRWGGQELSDWYVFVSIRTSYVNAHITPQPITTTTDRLRARPIRTGEADGLFTASAVCPEHLDRKL
jgi:hypothetical protein